MFKTGNSSLDRLAQLDKHGTMEVLRRGVQYVFLPIMLLALASTGLLVRPNILFSWIWLFVIVAFLAIPARHLVQEIQSRPRPQFRSGEHKAFGRDLKTYTVESSRGFKDRLTTTQAGSWVAALVLFALILVFILLGFANVLWVMIAGNRTYGYTGFGLWSVVIVLLSIWGAMICYYEVLKVSYREDGFNKKAVIFAVITSILLILPIGLSITHNAGF